MHFLVPEIYVRTSTQTPLPLPCTPYVMVVAGEEVESLTHSRSTNEILSIYITKLTCGTMCSPSCDIWGPSASRAERERGKSSEELLVGWLKHFGNLRRSAVKEVYMINVHQEGQIARDPLSS